MASRPKKVKVRKVDSVTQEPPKSQARQDESKESLIIKYGVLVEGLMGSEAWELIVKPLFDETIASVSGRFTNGRYWHGELTKGKEDTVFLRGYQKGVMDVYNRLHDFILAKDKMLDNQKKEAAQTKEPLINPYLDSD